ncbi:MAG: GntR family transcriptional regulator [Kiritimatiellia bacterium]
MSRGNMAYNITAQSIRERILKGVWQPGVRIKPERDLCEELHVSRITVRRALQILEEEGLISRRQGCGTFVNLHPSRRIPIVNGDYSASIIRHAPELRRVLKVCQYQPSVREQAIQLGIPPGGRVLFARRFDFLGEAVTAVDEVVVPAAFADMLQEQELRDFDFLERLYAVHKLPLDYESQALESLPAAAPVTEWLAVPPGAPLLKETNLVYLVGGTVLALFVSYYRHEFYQFKSISRIEDRGYSRRFGGI